MKLSEQGIKLIHEREGCKLKPYLDTKGVWTDGYGNTEGVIPNGPPISQEKAEADFERHKHVFEDSVNDCVKVELQQHQFDALASFAYNVGRYALANGGQPGPSSILRALNQGDYMGAGLAFNNWMRDPEVRTRRAGERDQFLGVAFEARRPV